MMPVISPGNGSSQPRSKSVRSSSQAAQMSSAWYSISVAARSCSDVWSARAPRSFGVGSSPWPSSRRRRAVDDEVGVAPDRRGEVRVRGAGEARVAEVARVVVRLLQRAQDERGERLLPTLGLAHVLGDALARLRGEAGRVRRGHAVALRNGRGRHLEVGELREHELDRLRLGRLVDAVERVAPAAREELGDGLVREDHQLLDQRMGLRLGLEPGTRSTPPWPSNAKLISRLSIRSAPRAKRRRRSSDEMRSVSSSAAVSSGSAFSPARIFSAWPYVSRSLLRMTER